MSVGRSGKFGVRSLTKIQFLHFVFGPQSLDRGAHKRPFRVISVSQGQIPSAVLGRYRESNRYGAIKVPDGDALFRRSLVQSCNKSRTGGSSPRVARGGMGGFQFPLTMQGKHERKTSFQLFFLPPATFAKTPNSVAKASSYK